jgi:hypothetical protein
MPRVELLRAGAGLCVRLNALVTKAEGNQREHWRAVHTRKAGQRLRVAAGLAEARRRSAAWPAGVPRQVTLVRLGPGTLDEGDNVSSALKSCRDEVAKFFGVDDGPRGPIRWAYAQHRRPVPGVDLLLFW